MNYFNISQIRFLSVDFRGHVGLPLISETLKCQCDHHYFASPFLSSDSAKKSKFWQFLGEFSWWKRPNIRDLKLDIFWKLCSCFLSLNFFLPPSEGPIKYPLSLGSFLVCAPLWFLHEVRMFYFKRAKYFGEKMSCPGDFGPNGPKLGPKYGFSSFMENWRV